MDVTPEQAIAATLGNVDTTPMQQGIETCKLDDFANVSFNVDHKVEGYDDASRTTPQQALKIMLKSIISALWTYDDMLPVMCAEVPERIEMEVDK